MYLLNVAEYPLMYPRSDTVVYRQIILYDLDAINRAVVKNVYSDG